MKLSILPTSLFPRFLSGEISIAQWASHVQELGTDGYDISIMLIPNSTPTFLNKIKKELKDANIKIQPFMVTTYPDFTHPDKFERERQIDYLIRDMALASDFGFQTMRITAGQDHPGLTLEEGVKTCVDCFARIVPASQKYGIKLVLENHSTPMAWPMIDFTFKPEAFLAIVDKMKDLPIGINFDTANAVACGADPIELLEKVISKVWTVHLNETRKVGIDIKGCQLGQGIVNFDAIFATLKKHGFDGWICIEEAGGNDWQGVDDAVKFARKYV
jgi:sugar phosphate isomerase/epimerase